MNKATITADGRLHIPKKLLTDLGYQGSTKVIIKTKGDEIIISKADKTCIICCGKENIIEGFSVCRPCAEKISDLLKLA